MMNSLVDILIRMFLLVFLYRSCDIFFSFCSASYGRADSSKLDFLSCPRASFEVLEPLLALETFLKFSWSARLQMVEQILASLASCLTYRRSLETCGAYACLINFFNVRDSARLHVVEQILARLASGLAMNKL